MLLLRVLLCGLLSLSWNAFAQAELFAPQQEFLPVEQAYQLDVEFQNDSLYVIWQIANDYYLYQHGFVNEWIDDAGNKQTIEITLPEGIQRHDEYFGDVVVYYNQVVLKLPMPTQKTLLKASSQGCADAGLCYPPYAQYFAIDAVNKTVSSIDKPQRHVSVRPNTAQSAPTTNAHLWLMLISAFIGGVILNLMPCVFPVLGIKALQLMQYYTPTQRRWHGMVYLLGVVISFVAIATLMLLLRSAGSAVGWGFQLQNPWFITLLVYLFFILSLAMAGFIQLGQSVMNAGQALTRGNSLWSAFFTGVLAVVVASPCTAPFMGAALGFAIAQSAWIALLIFVALALGMAAPLTLLSFVPSWAANMPKPGIWMERVKQFFAFPLMLTAVWLLWVLDNQVGSTAMSGVLAGCVLMVFAYWAWQGGRFAKLSAVFALIVMVLLVPLSASTAKPTVTKSPFVRYSANALAQLQNQGKPVFVDLTAAWCITCLANEKAVLHTELIQQAFQQAGITYMVGDWTEYDEEITHLIESYQRSGIPLYLLYPPNKEQPAIILPQILTKQIVLQAIDKM